MDYPEGKSSALLVGAENEHQNQYQDYRWVRNSNTGSNYGRELSLFAPGYQVRSDNSDPNNPTNINDSTSRASAVTAGVVALYLEGRTGMNDCGSHPIQAPSSSTGAAISTCPDRVSRFIRANANICSYDAIGCQKIYDRGSSPDRLLYTGYLPPRDNLNFNPIDNQRFFVWSQYADFEDTQPEPDESGLDYWTRNITDNCGRADFNYNGLCTDNTTHTEDWRINTSLAFWVDKHPTWFTTSYGLSGNTTNTDFIIEAYWRYLRRTVTCSDFETNCDSGVHFWVTDLNTYGTPANAAGVRHIIEAFITSGTSSYPGYRQRFGS